MAEETITLKLVAQDLASGNISKAIGKIDTLAKRGGIAGSVFQGIGLSMGMMLNPLNLAMRGFDMASQAISTMVDEARAFEDQMATVNTIAHLSETALGDLGKAVQTLAIKQGKQTDELTAGLYDLVSAGIDVADAMGVLEDATVLSIGSLSTTNEAVDLLTSTLNAYQFAAEDSARVSDIWAKSVEVGKVTAADLAGAVSQVLPVAASLGVELEEVAASFAFLSARGSEAGEVAQYMRQAMNALLKPTKELSQLQEELGVNFADIAREQGVAVALNQMRDAVGGNLEAMSRMLGRVQGLSYALTVTGENAADFNETLHEMGAPGAAADQMAERTDTMEFQVGRLNAQIEVFNQSAGLEMVRVITDVATALNDELLPKLAEFIQDMTAISWQQRARLEFERTWDSLTEGSRVSEESLSRLRQSWEATMGAIFMAGSESDAQGMMTVLGQRLPEQIELLTFALQAAESQNLRLAMSGIDTGRALSGAFEEPTNDALALGDAIETVAQHSFPQVRDAAKEAQQAIRNAFKTDSLGALRRELRTLERQRRRALREMDPGAFAAADARIKEVREQITAQRQVIRGMREELDAIRERRQARRQAADAAAEEAKAERQEARRNRQLEANFAEAREREGREEAAAGRSRRAEARRQIGLISTALGVSRDKARELKTQADTTFGRDAWYVDVDYGEILALTNRVNALDGRVINFTTSVIHGAGGLTTTSLPGRGRQHGGHVQAHTTYVVGERGPELLTMGATSGHVTPNHQLGGSIVINVGYAANARQFAAEVGPELERWRRGQRVA